jgi:riboflavin kinase / FMN adenylyltransferase
VQHESTPVSLAIGVFDGVHRGHQDLLHHTVADAQASGFVPAALTFDPDPETLVHPERDCRSLSTIAEREMLFRQLGIARIEIVSFTPEVAAQTAEEFLSALRERCNYQHLFVGEDFALGHDRAGTVEVLRRLGEERGFLVTGVPLLKHEGRAISSTWIREALAAGDVRLAQTLLGRPYAISGVVETGAQRGRHLGFPTANVAPPPGRALPTDGVYFVEVEVLDAPAEDGRQTNSLRAGASAYAVVNLGGRPTFGETERLLETHILDFQGDIYGAHLRVAFIEQLRGVQRFASVDELRLQIERDVATARRRIAG